MTNILTLSFAMVLTPFAVFSVENERPKARPNIIVILADDMGYSDLGCCGAFPTADRIEMARYSTNPAWRRVCATARPRQGH